MCFHLFNKEVSVLVLEILTNLSWISERGTLIVLKSLENFKERKNFNYLFEPFIRILEENKSLIMIANICTFIKTLVEAPK